MVGIVGSSPVAMNRVMVFIDGHYLKKGIGEILDGEINHEILANKITQRTTRANIKPILIRVIYYDALPNLDDAEKMKSDKGIDDAIKKFKIFTNKNKRILMK